MDRRMDSEVAGLGQAAAAAVAAAAVAASSRVDHGFPRLFDVQSL